MIGNVLPVAQQGLSIGGAGTWATFIAVLGGFGVLFRAGLVDFLKEWNRSRKERRDEDREEELSDKQQIAALSDRMSRMSGAFAFLANAVTVAVTALASEDHRTREQAASQSRELVAMAVSTLGNEDPYVKALDRLATVSPVDRSLGS